MVIQINLDSTETAYKRTYIRFYSFLNSDVSQSYWSFNIPKPYDPIESSLYSSHSLSSSPLSLPSSSSISIFFSERTKSYVDFFNYLLNIDYFVSISIDTVGGRCQHQSSSTEAQNSYRVFFQSPNFTAFITHMSFQSIKINS